MDGSATLPTGAIAMNISLTPTADGDNDDSNNVTPTNLIQQTIDLVGALGTETEYGEIETSTLDDRDGAKTIGTFMGSDSMLLSLMLDE